SEPGTVPDLCPRGLTAHEEVPGPSARHHREPGVPHRPAACPTTASRPVRRPQDGDGQRGPSTPRTVIHRIDRIPSSDGKESLKRVYLVARVVVPWLAI